VPPSTASTEATQTAVSPSTPAPAPVASTPTAVSIVPTQMELKIAERKVKEDLFYKTEFCNKEICPYKNKCRFAHSERERKCKPSVEFVKEQTLLKAHSLAYERVMGSPKP
jgi:hypothetical protein